MASDFPAAAVSRVSRWERYGNVAMAVGLAIVTVGSVVVLLLHAS